MNKHVKKAMEIRNEVPMMRNCAQTILMVYAKELGLTDDMAAKLSINFGGGMKCGATCGVITGGLIVLGALGIDDPYTVNLLRKEIAEKHDSMTNCTDLLRANATKGGNKKQHCDNMIYEAIEIIDKIIDQNKNESFEE